MYTDGLQMHYMSVVPQIISDNFTNFPVIPLIISSHKGGLEGESQIPTNHLNA
jgi:hypothetical protein